MKGIFQLVFIIIFVAGAIFGVLVFAGVIKIGEEANKIVGNVLIWGTAGNSEMSPIIDQFNRTYKSTNIKYVEKLPENFDQDLLEALASGAGPDIFFIPDNLAIRYSNKIFPIPYTSYSLVNYKNNFIGAGEVFLTTDGILAFPMTVDPLVMYYNKSIFNSNSIIYPPKTWDELSAMVPIITKKDNSNKIIKSGVALGQFTNIVHAKDILVAMFFQTNNPIIGSTGSSIGSTLNNFRDKPDLAPILQYYTSFADPTNANYSWNRSFSNSLDAFISENVAIYFGFSSELSTIISKNPNLNFGVAPIPQLEQLSKSTSSKVTGIAISSSSKNIPLAFTVASQIATTDFAEKYASVLSVPPARRDLLKAIQKDANAPIFYDSALYAKSWLDPSPSGSNDIFRIMIDSTLSNVRTAREAISDASSKLDLLLVR